MTCAEFQKVLPFIIDTGGGNAEEEAHLKTCPVCQGLVSDLKYIAEQAKLLVPMVDPSPKVWSGIQLSLEREGLVRPSSGTGRFQAPVAVMPSRWSPSSGLFALAALLLIAIALFTYRSWHNQPPLQPVMETASAPAPATDTMDPDDAQLLQEVGQRTPALQATYADSLRGVNSYIADAQRALAEHPDSQEARDHLMYAYDQKAMVYSMAVSSSTQ